jgi:beta-RFAP synthase
MSQSVVVQTPARLHWGLFRPAGDPGTTVFGGIGLMVNNPGVKIEVAAQSHASSVAWPERLVPILSRLQECQSRTSLQIKSISTPAAHAGFGSGTQLALATALAVSRLWGLSESPDHLIRASGRGLRSGIGCHGFFTGGLLVDAGKNHGESHVAPITDRVDLPEQLRIVIVLPEEPGQWHGRREVNAFRQLPGCDVLAERLRYLASAELLPAARSGDLARLGPLVHEFNSLAGEAFASVQGGVFASSAIAAAVDFARSNGIEGVGQSSWGPAVFALCEDYQQAEWLAGLYEKFGHYGLWIASPSRAGATLQVSVDDS